jgi:hypothetical protein
MILTLTTTLALHTGQCKHTGRHTGCSTKCTAQHGTAQAAACRSTPMYSCVSVVTCVLLLPHTAAGVTQNTWPGYHHTESRALAALGPGNRLTEPPATQLSNRRPLQETASPQAAAAGQGHSQEDTLPALLLLPLLLLQALTRGIYGEVVTHWQLQTPVNPHKMTDKGPQGAEVLHKVAVSLLPRLLTKASTLSSLSAMTWRVPSTARKMAAFTGMARHRAAVTPRHRPP